MFLYLQTYYHDINIYILYYIYFVIGKTLDTSVMLFSNIHDLLSFISNNL